MAEFERTTAVAATAEAVLDFLQEPANLPAWMPAVTLVESIAVDGDPDVPPDPEADAAPADAVARFHVDRAARTVEWGIGSYAATAEVRPLTPSMTNVAIRLRTPDDADQDAIRAMLDQAARGLGRRLTAR